jgi:hypothetical protein
MVECLATQTVRGAPGPVGELYFLLVEGQPRYPQRRRELTNGGSDAETVELIHPGWLDQVG